MDGTVKSAKYNGASNFVAGLPELWQQLHTRGTPRSKKIHKHVSAEKMAGELEKWRKIEK